jgi:hypothetical protein
MMLTQLAVWATVRMPGLAHQVLAAPTPTPAPSGGSGFDWDRVHPDGSVIPKSGIFYTIMNAVLFLGGVAAFCGLVGPIFGAHIVSDRGKSMMWKGGLVAIIVGSATAIIASLLVL